MRASARILIGVVLLGSAFGGGIVIGADLQAKAFHDSQLKHQQQQLIESKTKIHC